MGENFSVIYQGTLNNKCKARQEQHDWIVVETSRWGGRPRPYGTTNEVIYWSSQKELYECTERSQALRELFSISSHEFSGININIGLPNPAAINIYTPCLTPVWYTIVEHTGLHLRTSFTSNPL